MLLVDAFQGVEAQTVANALAAMEHNLTIVPVLNKVDLKNARPDEVTQEMEQVLAIKPDEVLHTSGKTGVGVAELLEAIVERIPPPTGDPECAAASDGVRFALRRVSRRDHLRAADERHGREGAENSLSQSRSHVTKCSSWASSCRNARRCEKLVAGQVGYLICNIKDARKMFTSATR